MNVRDLVDYVAEAKELEKLKIEETYESVPESPKIENNASELQEK
ncbi:MAG: hypothetical protein CM1200mP30_01540 [Pseudomonadota bacterium]|nr:MAG: hypothetical protein CM1200mP30_01540 [Pseudomonadota bacterium]